MKFSARLLTATVCVVMIAGCAAQRTQAQDGDMANVAGADTLPALALERGPCHGTCPVYGVQLFTDGRVLFTGIRFVRPVGSDSSRTSAAAIASLRDAFRSRKFSDVPARIEYDTPTCGQYVADLSTVVLTTYTGAASHTVRFDEGCRNHPMMLDTLARMVDSIGRTARWTTATRP